MSRHDWLAVALVPLALIVGVHVLEQVLDDWSVLQRHLHGPDDYLRLVRVTELWESGRWFDPVSERTNAPFGEVLHWTRPMDLLLLAGGALLAPFIGFTDGLYAWAVVASPLLHVLALFALIWAFRPLLRTDELALLAILFPLQLYLRFQFLTARPDHHALLTLLMIVLAGVLVRLATGTAGRRTLLAGGLATALMLWLSTEGLLGLALLQGGAGLVWLVAGTALVGPMRILSLATFIGLALALGLERPPDDWLTVEYDRLSIVHLLLAALLAAFWSMMAGLAPATDRARRGFGLAGAVAVIAVMALVFPAFFKGPLAEVDPALMQRWLGNNGEHFRFRPDLPPLAWLPGLWNDLGIAVLALPAYALILIRRRNPHMAWLLLALAALAFTALALPQGRFSGYAQLFLLPGLAVAVAAAVRLFAGPGLARLGLRTAISIVAVTGFILSAGMLNAWERGRGLHVQTERCPRGELYSWLDRRFDRPQVVMSFVYAGPEILYWSKHAAVASPYHRNGAGMWASDRFFSALEPERARAVAEQRGVGLVVVCARDDEGVSYLWRNEANLFRRLAAGDPPDWLVPLELTENLARWYRVYRRP